MNAKYVEDFTNGEVKGKTGSLTALPIIETQGGDVSALFPQMLYQLPMAKSFWRQIISMLA